MVLFVPTPTNAAHARLVEDNERFFLKIIEAIRAACPIADEIWCYGTNAQQPSAPTRQWDFMCLLPPTTSQATLMRVNALSGGLSEIQRHGVRYIDVQATINNGNRCAASVRAEGFPIWQRANDQRQQA